MSDIEFHEGMPFDIGDITNAFVIIDDLMNEYRSPKPLSITNHLPGSDRGTSTHFCLHAAPPPGATGSTGSIVPEPVYYNYSRPCVDYRRLNEISRAEFFPLPNMEEIVEKVSAAPYVTVMDLSKGYFQIPLTPRAQRYADFVTPFGTYIPKKMMFGLVCAPYYFCKLMAQVLEGLEQFALPYIDDIAIFPQEWKGHVKQCFSKFQYWRPPFQSQFLSRPPYTLIMY
ncbi:hypothetical protein TNCV_1344861 [Trichonephila clavipes]|nr:hypothetical protein TNCV_1344861 [Trichonephila clavipes]